MPPPVHPAAPPPPDDEGDESFRVNIPMDAVEGIDDAPDSGYVLLKYEKDDKGICLDLESAMMPDEQPAMAGEPGPDDDLESALGKIVNRKEPAENEGAMAED